MCRGEHEVFAAVNECALLLCIGPPKYEYKVLTLLGEATYGGIGKLFPSLTLVRACLVCLYGKRGIEQQHTLACPSGEIAMGWKGLAKVAQYLLENVL